MSYLALLLAFTSLAAGQGTKWKHLNGQWLCPENGKEVCVRLETQEEQSDGPKRAYLDGFVPKLVCFGFSGKQCDASFAISDDPRKNCEIFQAAMTQFPGDRSVRVETTPGPIEISCDPWKNDPVGPDENWVRKWDSQ